MLGILYCLLVSIEKKKRGVSGVYILSSQELVVSTMTFSPCKLGFSERWKSP